VPLKPVQAASPSIPATTSFFISFVLPQVICTGMAQAGFFPYQPKKQLNFGQTMKKTKGGP
jgi:hypothetical protein